MPSGNFKCIVVGGGPVGLIAAHALSRASIDFVVLEGRESLVIKTGASLVLLPIGLRVLGQLGLLEGVKQVSSPINQMERCDHLGNDLGDAHYFQAMKDNHGEYPRVVGRHDLTKVLYETLSPESQSCLLPNKKVSSIATNPEGVTVTCVDGTSFQGSMVIGADGAHSMVREKMRLLALEDSVSDDAATNAKDPFLTTYCGFWIRFPTNIGLRSGQVHETHGPGLATQLFAGNDTAVVGIYERLDKPTTLRSRYTEVDQDALVSRWPDLPIAKGLTFREVYDARTESGMVDLEEGVVQHWSWNRIVLVGDAAHKFTPSMGSGYNNGIIDVVVLVNELHKLLQSGDAAPSTPTPSELAAAFKAYQNSRYEVVAAGCKASSGATAMATWQNSVLRLMDQYVLPSHAVQRLLINRGASLTAKSPVFDFIKGTEPLTGKVPWVQPIKMAM